MVSRVMTVPRSAREARTFRAVPASARAARRFVRATLLHMGATPDVVRDFELAVSELAANAIEHGAGDELHVEVDGTGRRDWEVTIACLAASPRRLGAWRTWSVAGPHARSGRGLGIVRKLMDEVHVEVEPAAGDASRLVVSCRRRR